MCRSDLDLLKVRRAWLTGSAAIWRLARKLV